MAGVVQQIRLNGLEFPPRAGDSPHSGGPVKLIASGLAGQVPKVAHLLVQALAGL